MTEVLLALLGSIVVGETVRPIVNRFSVRVAPPLATALVFGALFLLLAVIALLPIQLLVGQIAALIAGVPRAVPFSLPPGTFDALGRLIARDPLGLVPTFSVVGLTLVMALFWLAASAQLTAFTLTLLPVSRRAEAQSIFTEIGSKLGAYVGGAILNSAVAAVLGTIGLLALHVPNAVVLGLFQGVLTGIPYLGTFIAVMTTLVVVGAGDGWLKAAEAGALIALLHTLVGTFVSPLIFKKRVNVDPLGCVISSAVGATLFGIPGIILAVPAASVIQTVVVRVVAPAIRRRSTAAVLIVLLAVAGASAPVKAQDARLTGNQILARAARADVSGYSVPIHFDVHLRRPVGARSGVDGVATYTAPAQATLTITQVPGPIGLFFRGTYELDLVPQTWGSKYHVTAVSEDVLGGAKVYVLQVQPVPASTDIDRVIFQIAQADFAPLSALWHYRNGSSIQLTLVDQHLNSLVVPKTATISVAMPRYALDATATYGAYSVR
jgi:predicted PurR-regulated permease PerM